MKLTNIILPSPPPASISSPNNDATTYDIGIKEHVIKSMTPHTHSDSNKGCHESTDRKGGNKSCPPPSLVLPSLCHPHIHLDKAYLLTSNYNDPLAYPACCPRQQQSLPDDKAPASQTTNSRSSESKDNNKLPDYSSLAPKSGSFPEALQLTSKAKQLYTRQDLYLRGAQLLATSYSQGVTSARCFVEVDHVTGLKALEVGLELKKKFEGSVRVQICAFAQDPIFSTEHGDRNQRLLEEALEKHTTQSQPLNDVEHRHFKPTGDREHRGIEVLGSTPYVESTREASINNVEWAIITALKYDLHLDFHLDYNLDESKPPDALMVWQVLRLLKEHKWPTSKERPLRTVVLGHCTAITLLSHARLLDLSSQIRESGLPVYFVGLPTSDLYMMGRPPSPSNLSLVERARTQPLNRPRGTLNPLVLQKEYGLSACLGVNNVGNAFTPFGTGDPLHLASMGVGLYHGGGAGDAERLYNCVSSGARRAIGLGTENDEGDQSGGGKDSENNGLDEVSSGFEVREAQNISEFGLLLVTNEEYIGDSQNATGTSLRVPARRRVSVRDVVWDVPEVGLRRVIR